MHAKCGQNDAGGQRPVFGNAHGKMTGNHARPLAVPPAGRTMPKSRSGIIAGMDSHGNYVLAHLSDLHLGYRAGHKLTGQGVNWREADGYKALDEMVRQILDDGTVDAVLIAGDVFHTPEPSIRSILAAQHAFRTLASNEKGKTPINKESIEQGSFYLFGYMMSETQRADYIPALFVDGKVKNADLSIYNPDDVWKYIKALPDMSHV